MGHLIALLIVAVAPQLGSPLSTDPALTRIRADFAKVPRAQSEAALEDVIARTGNDDARLWLGTLRYQAHDYARANELFLAIHDPALASLAHRGLGDVAFSRRRYSTAEAHYRAALDGAAPFAREELESKVASSHFRAGRSRIAYACLALYFVVLARLLWRLRRGRNWPKEATFLLPVYALFVVGGVSHDPQTAAGVGLIALGSLLSIGALFAAPGRRTLDVALTTLANAALAYAVLWATGLWLLA